MSKPAPPIAVKVVTAAEMLDCSRQHVVNLIERGELRRTTIGSSKTVRIPVADIYRVLGLGPEAGDAA
jgi:excisionase family DNA binding protein